MAEYYPLLERAVSGLRDAPPEARHAIYDRARNALLGQLRAMDPPVPEADIDRESTALDDAIERLEAGLRAPPSQPAASPPVASPPVASPPVAPPPVTDAPMRPQAEPATAVARAPAVPPGGARAATPPPQRERPVFTPRPPGVEPGGVPTRPAAAVLRPRIGADRAEATPSAAEQPRPAPGSRPPGSAPRPSGAAPRIGVPAPPVPKAAAPDAAASSGVSGEPTSTLPTAPTLTIAEDKAFAGVDPPAITSDPATPHRGRPSLARPAAPVPVPAKKRGLAFYAGLCVLLLITAGIAVAAYRLRDHADQVTAAKGPTIVTAPDNPSKIIGRAEGPDAADQSSPQAGSNPAIVPASPDGQDASAPVAAGPSTPAPTQPQSPGGGDTVEAPAIGVSQRAALLVDAPQDPQKVKTYVGSVVWRTESVSPGQDQPLATAVRADVDIPDAKLSMSMVLKKNTEPQFPASHTLEFHFTPQAGNTLGPIKQINVPEMRQDDNAPTGDPLIGVPVAITEDYFLVGLSHGAAEPGNLALIQQRNWVDISLLFSSGKVAKITFEKGPTGQRIIDDAIKSWQ